jgi:FKBP-type peptidyl-prolyl cis-trans isomerase FklB
MMKKSINFSCLIAFSVIAMFSCSDSLQKKGNVELKTRMDTISYIIGLDYGTGIKEKKIDVNEVAVKLGLSDGLQGRSLISDSSKNKIIDQFNELLKIKELEENKKAIEKNRQDGLNFLEENKKKEGIVVLPDGLQFKVLKDGEGQHPSSADSVKIHYRAMFIDRKTFDMSYDRGPVGIRLNKVIRGLSEGVQQMKPGSIYELYIPPALAYGDENFANVIPAGSTLIYSIELIEIIKNNNK